MKKRRILIVDDEPKVAFFFQQHLALVDENYQAKAVNSGFAAIEELQQYHYDLMITDLRMPKMDGIELLRRVKNISPQTKTILVTAYGSDEVWEEARRLEIFRSLSKPLKIPDLLSSVREAFSPPRLETKSSILALTGENFEKLSATIEALRVDVGAQTVVVADTTGRILVHAGSLDAIDLDATLALLGGTMAASSELAHQLDYPQPLYLSHFEGPPYDLYATNLGNDFFLTIVQSRHREASRIGVVWLYTRRASQEITELLGQETTQTELEVGFAESIQSELDNLFIGDTAPLAPPIVHFIQAEQTPTAVSTATAATLSQDISAILGQFSRQTGLVVEKRLSALDQPLSPLAVNLLLRTISYGLKNIHQYAHASIIGVSFNSDNQNLYGRIVDDGVGFESSYCPQMKSLKRLQTAYQQAGGSLELSGYPNQGASLTVTLPLHSKAYF